jgi:sarcosine oxidase
MARSERYDCIVIGVGGMGSAATYRLAERGFDTLGIERYDVPHAMGSSHGDTRIVRLTQPEDPSYVPLARDAFDAWRDLERATGRELLTVTGSVHAGPADGAFVADARRSLDEHGVDYETYDGAALADAFPGYDLPADYEAVHQPDGGFVYPERAICAHVDAAHDAGATIRARERVESWRETADGVRVETDGGRYEADDVVFAAGAWTGTLLPSLAPHLRPVRRVMAWFQPEQPALFAPDRFPVFSLDGEDVGGYGFPRADRPGFKLGVEPRDGDGDDDGVDPDALAREPTPDDERRLRAFAERFFPDGAGPTLRLAPCLYTKSPDEHFVVGSHPGYDGAHVAAGFTGHGFKFTAVVGRVLADLVERGTTDHVLDRHRIERLPLAGG